MHLKRIQKFVDASFLFVVTSNGALQLSQLEHILKRPDSYIGSVETITQPMWAWDSEKNRMVHREIKYVPGFFKIVDEILVNAADNKINDSNMDTVKVTIDAENNTISVYNNGGRNGYGAKLANIYSVEFTVDTADKASGQKYVQTWTDNMSKMGKAKITKNGRGEEYTRVTFKPDLKRFGMDCIDEDTVALLKKRVHDLAGTVKDVKVFLNDERLKIKGFKQYVELYINSAAEEAAETSGGAAQPKQSVIFEQIDKRWEVAFAVSEGIPQQVSFANSISTVKGGTHVTVIADQIAKALIASITKKNKGAAVKPAQVKNHMCQTKETLTLPASKFGTKPVLSEEFMKKVQKSSIIDHILNWAKFKADQQLKKTDGSRRTRLTGLPKLSDANNAGTKKAHECLGVVGRDNYGVFPLRGKLLNVRDAKHDQIMKNEEIQNIKKILGLQHNKVYTDANGLRYGRLMLMTDQDHDGSHIKGLLINYIDHFYPSLLKIPRFLVEFVTPVVRVWKGKEKINFYTIPEYERWKAETPNSQKWDFKYYKGLGTSKDEDARDYFSDMKRHMIPFSTAEEGDRELIELAFSKKKADDRKEWLRQFKPGTYLDHTQREISMSDFINRELILFSMADNIRSIPFVSDGLKPGQRKVVWACFKIKLAKEMKVAQLVGYVSGLSAYHHGEQSLMATIINLAQDFVGSNNMNLLMPNGQFGSRDQGGKDHASARYIYTEVAPIVRTVIHPADDAVLTYQQEDGKDLEPDFYMPIIPLVLVNGAEGIGTGWSTTIPSYNPEDIVANILRVMNGEEQVPMMPWWRGFTGTIKKVGEHKYDVFGTVNKIDDTTVEITELPVHKWTQTYKTELETMCGEKGDGVIKDYKEHHTNMNVHFVINMAEKDLEKAEKQGLHEFFKLTTKINTSNMICFDFDGKIKRYASPEGIIEDFYPRRLAYYQKRKDFMANELQNQLERLNNQARFVQMIVDKELVVSNRKKTDIVAELRKKQFRPFPKVAKAKAMGEDEPAVDDEEEGTASDFDYLLGMQIWSLTKEKIEKLRQQGRDKEAELLALLELTPIQMWQTDLDRFLGEWKVTFHSSALQVPILIYRSAEHLCHLGGKVFAANATAKNSKRKQTKLPLFGAGKKVAKTEESDDDFKPTKAAAKAKKAGPVKKTAAAVPSGSNLALKEEDDDDDVPPPPPKKAAKKVIAKSESESDFEMYAAKSKTAPSGKKKVTPKSSDSDVEIIPASKDKGKGKAGAAPAAKRKSPASDEESDDAIDDDMLIEAAPKKAGKASQAAVTDFFNKVPAAAAAKKSAARKPSSSSQSGAGKAKAASKKTATKKVVNSDADMSDDDAVPAPPPREAPKRAARAVVSKYIEITSEDEGGDQDGSDFEDFD
ncbi:DNA topoisomerase 2 [Grifola frondosa]|uniref:DNA topoisomerase 2 n=1 Tax=Grifola frondosa TaxID=5627 RepID=A0A1C7MT80_GRIFR|nr:DNA topoisomerase 2 [Grifola frondosa]